MAQSPLYLWVLNQWQQRKYTEADVRSRVPKWITAEEAETIIATDQWPIDQAGNVVAPK